LSRQDKADIGEGIINLEEYGSFIRFLTIQRRITEEDVEAYYESAEAFETFAFVLFEASHGV
jgi:hypothetical protein